MDFRIGTTKTFATVLLTVTAFFSAPAQTAGTSGPYRIPAGTKIALRMDNEINSEVSGKDDTFTATVTEPVTVNGIVLVTEGAVVEGRITRVKRPRTAGRRGSLSVAFESLTLVTGEKRPISGVLDQELKPGSAMRENLLITAGATAAGALAGTVSGGGRKAMIGAGVGLGIGGAAALRKGKHVRIGTNERFEIRITREVTLPVTDY
jgi:hypothetical protein